MSDDKKNTITNSNLNTTDTNAAANITSDNNLVYDYLIIGAGPTGLTLCHKLREKNKNVLVLEAESEAGGLCQTKYIENHIMDIGGHFLQTKYDDVYDFIFSFYPKENLYQIDPRIAQIKLADLDIDYPLESNLWQFPLEQQIKYLISVIRNGEALGKPSPKNYEEWIRWKLGDEICDNYLIPYNIKLWGVEPKELDIDWLYKIPRINVDEVLKYSLEKKQDVEKYPCHVRPFYPKKNGYGEVMNAIAKPILKYIKLNYEVNKLLYNENDKTWLINDVYKAKNVINAGCPWNELYRFLGKPKEISKDIEKIKYNKVVCSLYESEQKHKFHWRYIPDLKEQHHREFPIYNFVKNSPKGAYFTETNLNRFNENALTFNGKNIYNYTTRAAYPIPTIGKQKAITNILEYFKKRNLFGVGRWGEHQHHNHDVCIKMAMEFCSGVV